MTKLEKQFEILRQWVCDFNVPLCPIQNRSKAPHVASGVGGFKCATTNYEKILRFCGHGDDESYDNWLNDNWLMSNFDTDNHQNWCAYIEETPYVVLDFDSKEAWNWWLEEYGEPDTLIIKTSRGYHCWFEAPKGTTKNYLKNNSIFEDLPYWEKIEMKTKTIIVPPTDFVDMNNNTKKYRFFNQKEIAELPMDIMRLFFERKKKARVAKSTSNLKKDISGWGMEDLFAAELEEIANAKEGQRYFALRRNACRVFGGCDVTGWRDAAKLMAHAARRAGLGDDEIKNTILSAKKYIYG